jgi:hypothetical protein
MTYILEIAEVELSRPDFLGDTLRNQVPLFIERQALKGTTYHVYKISGDICHSETFRNENITFLFTLRGAGTALMTYILEIFFFRNGYILEIAGVEGSRPDFMGDTLRNQVPLFIERQALKGRAGHVYKIFVDICHSETFRNEKITFLFTLRDLPKHEDQIMS